ncbi:hypothetical protein ACPPVW_18615 [Leifsonia sp. McL0607]|uniref:hypothetical protein n=1 Tax=Leifsonia sp. McL0607 TaxID=3415672 RepID=UPI003CEB182C
MTDIDRRKARPALPGILSKRNIGCLIGACLLYVAATIAPAGIRDIAAAWEAATNAERVSFAGVLFSASAYAIAVALVILVFARLLIAVIFEGKYARDVAMRVGGNEEDAF